MGGPNRGMYTLPHSYFFQKLLQFLPEHNSKSPKKGPKGDLKSDIKFRLWTPWEMSPIYRVSQKCYLAIFVINGLMLITDQQTDCYALRPFYDLKFQFWLFESFPNGTCQKRFSGFCPLRGYPLPPPTPVKLTENYFAKKPLAELGGTPSPPLTENQCEKKKDFFLSGKGGTPSPPLTDKIR